MICIIYHTVTNYFIAMYSVGYSSSIVCTLLGVSVYTWYNEVDDIVANGDRLRYSANDTIHHKIFTCSGLSNITMNYRAIYIKFVINGNESDHKSLAIIITHVT